MFFQDMGPRPKGMTLDRIDNNLGYCKENCGWVTPAEQSSNRRNCIYVSFGGEKVTLKEACRRYGINYRVTHQRIFRDGWTIEKALSVSGGI
jgi:hypothetical protein